MLIGGIVSSILSLLLTLDGIIYDLIRYFYEIFLFIAKLNIFEESDYNQIVSRIYVVLGVVMLFILAYSLLKAVINPDEFAKGENAFPNVIKNVVISLIIIVILPTVFKVAFNIQAALLNRDVIGQVILGQGADVEDGGNMIAYNAYRAFFHPSYEYCEDKGKTGDIEGACAETLETNHFWFWTDTDSLDETIEDVKSGEASFRAFGAYSDEADEGNISYLFIISTIFGIVLLLIVVSYCIDLGVRVVKLAFYQIIAPIPVICRVMPGDKKKIFSTWTKQTISTFLEVFIRIAIMYLGIYLIQLIINKFGTGAGAIDFPNSFGFVQRALVVAFLILGVILFVRQAPKLIKDLFGIDLGGGGMFPLTKMLAMGAAVGAGTTAMSRNFFSSMRKDQGLLKSLGSGAAGFASGATRGAWNARNAKGFKDMKGAASAGASGATEAKRKRAAYKASHGGTLGAMFGHVSDFGDKISAWSGADSGLADLQAEQAVYSEGMGFKKELFDLVSDNESVMAYQGLKTAAQERELTDYTQYYKLDKNGLVYDKRNGSILTDKDGNTFTNAEAAAIFMKTQEIEKYDTAIKLASMRAIHEKLESGDGRFQAQFEKFKVYQQQHSDNALVRELQMRDITASELQQINNALNSNSYDAISNVKKVLEAEGSSSVLANDKKFKIANGDVQAKISQKIQEKKKDSK